MQVNGRPGTLALETDNNNKILIKKIIAVDLVTVFSSLSLV